MFSGVVAYHSISVNWFHCNVIAPSKHETHYVTVPISQHPSAITLKLQCLRLNILNREFVATALILRSNVMQRIKA